METSSQFIILIFVAFKICIDLKNTGSGTMEKIRELFAGNRKKVVIVPHESPDGDAIGSSVGLSIVLTEAGHSVNIVSPNDFPLFLKWLVPSVPVMVYEFEKQQCKEVFSNAEILVCLDFNEPKRSGKLEKALKNFDGIKILVDHHPYPTDFCTYTVSEPHYSSTSELIYDVIDLCGLGHHVTPKAAEAFYTGILTDTGSFSHNISNPNMFRTVARLIEIGVNTGKVQSAVYHNFTADRMSLLGYCLNRKMEVLPQYRTAIISITKEEQEQFNFMIGDSEGFVNYPLSIKDIVFSVLFTEKEGLVKVSFRSKGNFPVNKFATTHFGGGGHLNAAGGESHLSLDETISKFRQLIADYKHQLMETEI